MTPRTNQKTSTAGRSFLRLLKQGLYLTAVILCLKWWWGHTLGMQLTKQFSKGTGCIVHLENPRVGLFPPRATIENVSIRAPHEKVNEGFTAKEISVRLHFLPLFKKKIVLSNLRIEGAHAVSIGSQTGFINTIRFVTTHPSPEKMPKKGEPFFPKWSLRLTDLEVRSRNAPGPELILATSSPSSPRFAWEDVNFRLVLHEAKEIPNEMFGTASILSLVTAGLEPIPLGALDAQALIGGGKINFPKLSLINKNNNEKFLACSGALLLGKEGGYDLLCAGVIESNTLPKLFPQYQTILEQREPKIELKGRLGGSFLTPQAVGSFGIFLKNPLPLFQREACSLKQITANFSVDHERLALSGMNLDDLVENASFELRFDETFSLQSQFQVALNPEKEFVKLCLSVSGENHHEQAMESMLQQAISDSKTDFEMKGTLTPFSLEGVLKGDLHMSTGSVHSKVRANYLYRNRAVHLSLTEEGAIPHIQPEHVSSEESSIETRFETQSHSNIALDLQYDTAVGDVVINNLEVVRYPALSLLARLAPFLPEQFFQSVAAAITTESTLNTKGKYTYNENGKFLSGGGTLSLTNFKLGILPTKELHLTALFEKGTSSLKNISLESYGGTILGEIALSSTKTLLGGFQVKNLDLSAFPAWREHFPQFPSTINGSMNLTGSLSQPQLSGDLKMSSIYAEAKEESYLSDLHIQGDRDLISGEGSLFNNKAQLKFSMPTMGEEQIDVEVKATDLPISMFLVKRQRDIPKTHGTMTAELNFHGPRNQFLSGNGKLSVSAFSLNVGETLLTISKPLIISMGEGKLQCGDCVFLVNNEELQIAGYVDKESGWNTTLSGAWTLKGFRFSGLEQLSGDVEAKISVRGPLEAPSFNGPIVLSNGTLSFPVRESIIGVNDVTIQATMSGDTIEISDIHGLMGEGLVRGSGNILHLFRSSERYIDTHFTFTDILIEPIPNLTVNANIELAVEKKPLLPLAVTGDIKLLNALYEDTIGTEEIVRGIIGMVRGKRSVSTTATTDEEEGNVQLNLHLISENSLLIETNVFRGELAGEVSITESLHAPRFEGSVRALEGIFGFQSSQFEIIHGKLTFPQTTQVDPLIDIRGETTVVSTAGDEYQVQLSITGTLSKPQLRFTSNSGLPEKDLVYLLTFGGRAQEVTLLGLRKGAKSLSYQEILDPSTDLDFEERVSGLTGFSEVNISAGSSLETGEYVPTITATRPITDKTDFSLRAELAGEQYHEAQLNYSLTPHLNFKTEWRTPSATNPASGTGNAGVGLEYKRSFPGLTLFPKRASD